MQLKFIYFTKRVLQLICILMLLTQAACSPIGLAVGAGDALRATPGWIQTSEPVVKLIRRRHAKVIDA